MNWFAKICLETKNNISYMNHADDIISTVLQIENLS